MKNKIAITCFFLSGFAGLVYEIAWIRKASLVFGSTTWALSTILAVFFGGLALGSWYFGRLGQRSERPIRLYALLEVILAALGLATLISFDLADGIFGIVYRANVQPAVDGDGLVWLGAGAGLILARFGLVAIALLPPSIVMGGTLPLFCRQFVVQRNRISGGIGFLYGVNTLGAALGTVATGFFILPRFGLTAAIVTAAIINLGIGVVALLLKFPSVPPVAATARQKDTTAAINPAMNRPLRRLMPILFFGAGLVAIGAEVFWSRFLALVVRNSVYTYTITLAVVLFGIVLGSLLVARLRDFRFWKRISAGTLFGFFQILSALFMVLFLFQPAAFWRGLGEGLTPFFLLMLPSAILSGACFPLANRMVLDDPRFSAVSVGRMTAFNTAGGITGSLVAGFLLLPVLGLATGVKILTFVGILTGATAWFMARRQAGGGRFRKHLAAICVSAAAILAWWFLPLATGTRLPADFLSRSGPLIDYAEGDGSTLAAIDLDGALRLEIDNLWQGEDIKGHQIMAAHVPALLHGAPENVLVIGVGVGQTAGRFLYHDVARLDCVDIEGEIFPFIKRNFDASWMADPRVTLIPDDGRTFTAHTDRQYDIISVEVGQTFRPGIDVFYNREFYRDAKARLKTDGFVAQFVPLGFLEKEQFQSVVATFLESFPRAVLWYNTQELLLIGSPQRTPVLDLDRMADLAATVATGAGDPRDERLAADLRYSHWGGARFHVVQPGVMLGGFLAGEEMLVRMTADAPVYTDDLPILAYATSNIQVGDHFEEKMARYLADHLSPFRSVLADRAGAEVLALAERTRRLNLRDLVAAGLLADATAGQAANPPARTMTLLRSALETNPESFLGHYNTGKFLLMTHRTPQAESFLQKAVEMQPESGKARRDLGLVYVSGNRPAEALPHLRAAAELLPRDPAVFNYLGTALALSGRFTEALASFARSLELEPDDQAVIANLNRARASLRSEGDR